MAKSDELVKYITQRVVTYIEVPKEERRQRREARRRPKEPWAVRWFGLLPMAIGMLWKRGGNKELSGDKDELSR